MFHGARAIFNCWAISLLLQFCASGLRPSASRTLILISPIFLTWTSGIVPDFASSANGFAEKQLFRHVFSGEQKETYPLNAAIWLQKRISLYNFQRKNPLNLGQTVLQWNRKSACIDRVE